VLPRFLLCVLLVVSLQPARVPAQAPGRIATTAPALLGSPVFFHGKQIAIRATVPERADVTRLDVAPAVDPPAHKGPQNRPIFVFWKERPSRDEGEIRGEFWDLGRINEGDGRFAAYDFRSLLDRVTNGRWPGREEIFIIVAATMLEAPLPTAPTLRAIALAPEEYESRAVTVSGRFRGRNLYGDLPGPINKSKWDFVLHSADAAVWVSGVRPRGRNFDLDPGARVDTGRWLQVSGMIRTEGVSVWIEAKTIELSSAPTETPVEIAVPVTPREPPPEVVFSAPVADETDVERGTTVRIQFSRDMDGRTFKDRVRVSYVPRPRGGQPLESPAFNARYNEGTRGMEIRFALPLERFQTVQVELLDGVTALDGQPLKPWTLRFTTGA
jgi:hypothetical protein